MAWVQDFGSIPNRLIVCLVCKACWFLFSLSCWMVCLVWVLVSFQFPFCLIDLHFALQLLISLQQRVHELSCIGEMLDLDLVKTWSREITMHIQASSIGWFLYLNQHRLFTQMAHTCQNDHVSSTLTFLSFGKGRNLCSFSWIHLQSLGILYVVNCCMYGWTSRNTGVYPTLLQRGG